MTAAAHSVEPPRAHVLRQYALIADGERGALVDPDGNIAWLCFPRWHDPALLAGIWGSGGLYRVRPAERAVWGGHYEYGSLIWASRWHAEHGVVQSRDALAMPGDAEHAVLLRRVSVSGSPQQVVVELELSGDYGRRPLGGWRERAGLWQASSDELTAFWSPGGEVEVLRLGSKRTLLRRLVEIRPDEPLDLVLELVSRRGGEAAPSKLTADQLWADTERGWSWRVPERAPAAAERDVRQAVAVLRGLTSASGGTVAAATASLPEHAREGRDYDYRYVWIRDLCYVGQAGAALGAGGEQMLDSAVRFVCERLGEDGPKLMPAYTADGKAVPAQESLELPGYPGGHDVIGNQVRGQFQLDGFGESLLLLAAAARAGRLDADGWRAASAALAGIEQRWQEPDAGVWELDARFWAHSRLSCVAGLKAICSAGAPAEWTRRYLPLAEQILAETGASCLHPSGRWQRAPDDERVDAALVVPAIRGALELEDPRSLATVRAVAAELVEDGYVYRYAHANHALGQAEGAFLICNFWMSLDGARRGDLVSAIRYFERARTACGSPGLLTEEFDVDKRQLVGNLPQAFVHAALIEAAVAQRELEP